MATLDRKDLASLPAKEAAAAWRTRSLEKCSDDCSAAEDRTASAAVCRVGSAAEDRPVALAVYPAGFPAQY